METPSTKIPHTFQRFESAGGAQIFRIPMKAFPNFWVYAYLVLADGYVALIDAGSGFGDSNADLEAGFGQAGHLLGREIRFQDLTHILITHAHIDHFGGLTFLRQRSQALIGVHELDLGSLTSYEERVALAEKRLKAYLIESGFPQAKHEDVLELYRINKMLFHSVSADFTYESEGMRLGPFEMLHVPGHCAGHVVIRLHDILFSGDHVLDRISPHQWPERLTHWAGLRHYFDSLALVVDWARDVSLTLPGHNDPLTDLPGRVGEIRQLHAARLQRVLEFLAEPRTIMEVSRELFGRVSGYDVLLALEEAGANVEYLYHRGLVRVANPDDVNSGDCPAVIRYIQIDAPVAKTVALFRS
jgi:glyoxylase-like metal-dependent hydrolase (beta-lactamase superfamily II)